jgi:GrpB-like predicted nucleotidyltransferase (UPF0157 family)
VFEVSAGDRVVMREVHVAPPNASWDAQFHHEANLIRAAFIGYDIEIHHVGSTAIKGIYAKPVIDILLLVEDLSVADSKVSAMQGLGYQALGEYGIVGRRYFRKNAANRTRTHHVHSFLRGSNEAIRHLAFRDYMNAHPDVAEEYGLLKLRLANAFPDDAEAYMDGKDGFVKRHEALALAEYASQ